MISIIHKLTGSGLKQCVDECFERYDRLREKQEREVEDAENERKCNLRQKSLFTLF